VQAFNQAQSLTVRGRAGIGQAQSFTGQGRAGIGQTQSLTVRGRAGIQSGTELDSARTCRHRAGTELHRARPCRHLVRHNTSAHQKDTQPRCKSVLCMFLRHRSYKRPLISYRGNEHRKGAHTYHHWFLTE